MHRESGFRLAANGHRLLAAGLALYLSAPAGVLAESGSVQSAERLSVSCERGLLSAEAGQIGLRDLFDEVGRRCGFGVAYLNLPDHPVSANLPPTPFEQGLRRLLAQTGVGSHAAVYGPIRQGEAPMPERVILLGWGSESPVVSAPEPPPRPPAVIPEVAVVPKPHFAERLRASADIPEGVPTVRDVSGRETKAFEVGSVGDDSLLGLVGLQSGDILLNVNGIPIESEESLSQALQTGMAGPETNLRFVFQRKGEPMIRYLVGR